VRPIVHRALDAGQEEVDPARVDLAVRQEPGVQPELTNAVGKLDHRVVVEGAGHVLLDDGGDVRVLGDDVLELAERLRVDLTVHPELVASDFELGDFDLVHHDDDRDLAQRRGNEREGQHAECTQDPPPFPDTPPRGRRSRFGPRWWRQRRVHGRAR